MTEKSLYGVAPERIAELPGFGLSKPRQWEDYEVKQAYQGKQTLVLYRDSKGKIRSKNLPSAGRPELDLYLEGMVHEGNSVQRVYAGVNTKSIKDGLFPFSSFEAFSTDYLDSVILQRTQPEGETQK